MQETKAVILSSWEHGLAARQAHCQVVQYQKQAPWAFEAGDPFRVVASLEL